jgi:hypothetical protein
MTGLRAGLLWATLRAGTIVPGWAGGVVCAVSAGCATASVAPPSVGVQISGNVPDATIWIDDRLRGRVADYSKPGQRLPVGFHRLEVRAPGYYSHFQEVDAHVGTNVTIRADLHELLD